MNTKQLSIALAALAGITGAQTPVAEDAAARQQAAAASQKAASAEAKASEAAKTAEGVKEQADAIDGKLTGLEENYLETKATVAALAKLKISGLAQVQGQYYLDTGLVSSSRTQQQGYFRVRRGRLKATYDAGNGASFVTQYNINETGLSAQDIYLKWNEPFLKTFSVQAGLQDIPFGYEIGYSSSTMEWLERSRFVSNAMFAGEKDIGFVFGAAPKVPGLDAFEAKVAVMSGWGLAANQADPNAMIGRLVAGKDFVDVGVGLKIGGSYYMESFKNQVAPVAAKAAVKYKNATLASTPLDSVAAVKAVNSDYYVVDGSENFKKTGFRDELDANLVGADIQLTADLSMIPGFAGAKFTGEMYTGTAIGLSGSNKRLAAITDALYQRDLLAWYVAYVQNIGKSIQTVVRYDAYDPNTNVSGDEIGKKAADGKTIVNGTSKTDIQYSTLYLGLNYFVNGNTKLSVGYDMVSNETTSNLKSTSAISDFSKDADDDFVTVRAQFAF